AMVGCFAYGETVLAERYIEGTEVAVTVVEHEGRPEALPAVEIVPEHSIYDYTARYTAGLTDFFTPARLSPETAAALGELAVAAHQRLGLRDVSRTDAVLQEDGTVQFLDVNLAPALTEPPTVPIHAEAPGGSL